MINKIHYIKEDYSGNSEKFCLSSLKRDYPDFEFFAWKPGSSPLRILYDHGGIFFGPNIISLKKLPDFNKPFFVFDNSFESTVPNYNLISGSPEKESPILLEFMENGTLNTLLKKGFDNTNKVGLNEKNYYLPEIDILNFKEYLGFDKKIFEYYPGSFALDTNFNLNKFSDIHLHYLVIDEDTTSNKVFSVSESFGKMKYEDGSQHFLLLVVTAPRHDLVSRIGTLLQYHCTSGRKFFDIILPIGIDNPEGIVAEYMARKFNNVLSCEKL